MTLSIAPESPLSPDAQELIKGSEFALRAVYTEDECFTFTANELAQPEITFFVARQNGDPVGCVALCNHDTYGEIKRLFVAKQGRGQGIAQALMAHLERAALSLGFRWVKLETGDKLQAAVALYRRLGYRVCGPFGDYGEHPASLFMQKGL